MNHEHHDKKKTEPTCCAPQGKKWFQNKTLVTALILFLVLGASYFFSILHPFRHTLFMYVHAVWWALLLGLFIGGLVDYYIPHQLIPNVLARPEKKTIFYSVGVGFLASVCSHGILAISMELYRKGASTSSVIAFLLASPWANLSWSLVLISLFGFGKALYIIAVAIVIAITTGLIYQILESKGWVERNPRTGTLIQNYSAWQDIKNKFLGYQLSTTQLKKDLKGVWKGSLSLADMVLWWILLGIILASLSGAYIPPNIFREYMGPTVVGLLITLGLATILEVCSEGMSPLSFEIYRQTGALGNSLVFLMAGVSTDYTEIGLLWQNIGKKTALWLPVIAVPQIIFWGILANILF